MLATKPEASCPVLTDVSVDEAIMQWISGDRDRVLCTYLGDSSWSWPIRVTLVKGSSTVKSYFVKIAKSDLGMSMLRGEYESMRLLHAIAPVNVVAPLARGACASQADHYFYISAFHDLADEQPDVSAFCAMTAHLHTSSANLFEWGEIRPVPGGRIGFHVITHMGTFPQDNGWADTWEAFFARGLCRILAVEADVQGRSEVLDAAAAGLLGKVIPRLLRPLETGGRRIRPALVHGDLQIRNVKTNRATGQPIVFDAGSFWAHNEYDLGKWRPERFSIGRQYMDEYHKLVPKSDPAEDWEDRNILYSIRFNLLSSAHYAGNPEPRQLALTDIRYLVDKYADGHNGE